MGLVLWLLIVVGALFLIGVIGGSTTEAVSPETAFPTQDVAGADFADLPRMTGSMRVEYKDFLQGQWAVTEVEYLTTAPMAEVQRFYRASFLEHDWSLLSVDSTGQEWVYGVSSGMREGVVEIEQTDAYVNVEIELHRLVAPTKIGDEDAK
jgi:hypothetical protein